MKKSIFAQTCDEMLKSMAAEDAKDKDEEITDQDEPEFDFDETDEDEEQEEEDKEETKKSCKKSLDEDMVDGTELIKSLKDENEAIHEELRELRKSMDDLGQANVLLAEMVKSLSDEPLPMNSTMSKSIDMTAKNTAQPEGRPTQEDFMMVRDILCKSVAAGKLDLVKSTMYENEVQMAMKTGKKMSDECFNFISNEMKNR